jgi:hypothetical protein
MMSGTCCPVDVFEPERCSPQMGIAASSADIDDAEGFDASPFDARDRDEIASTSPVQQRLRL